MVVLIDTNIILDVLEKRTPFYPMCHKTPSFSYGDIRHVHRIYPSN